MACRDSTSRGAKAAKVDADTPTQAAASEAKLNGSAATPAASRKSAIKTETGSGARRACKVLTCSSVELMCLQHISRQVCICCLTLLCLLTLKAIHAMPCSLAHPFS